MLLVRDFLADQSIHRSDHVPANPLVSVILPTFARCASGQLAKALGSVLAQSFTDFELLVMDDGSRDGSSALIEEFRAQDPRVVHVRHERNSGLPALRANEGIELARGRYVAFQFDDDTWRPQALELLLGKAQRYGEEAVIVGTSLFHYATYDELMPAVDLNHAALFECNRFANNTVLVPRQLFDHFGMYDCHIANRRCCDWDLWLRLIKHVPFRVVTEVVADIYPSQDGSIGETAPFDQDLFRYIHDIPRDRCLTPQSWQDFQVDGLQYGPIPLAGEWRRRVREEHITPFCTRFGHPICAPDTGASPHPLGKRLEVALVHERHDACDYAYFYNYDESAAVRQSVKVRFEHPLRYRGAELKTVSDAVLLVRRASACDADTAHHARQAGLPLAYFLDESTLRRHALDDASGSGAASEATSTCLKNLLTVADAVWVTNQAAAAAAHTCNPRTIMHHACLPAEFLPERLPRRDANRPVRIGLFCGDGQRQEYAVLWVALLQVALEFPGTVEFMFWRLDAATLPTLPAVVHTSEQPTEYFQRLRQLRQSGIDILVVPSAFDGSGEPGPAGDWYHGAAVAGALAVVSETLLPSTEPLDKTCLSAAPTAAAWHEVLRKAITLPAQEFDALRHACIAHVSDTATSSALIDCYEAAWRATQFHSLTGPGRYPDGRPRVACFVASAPPDETGLMRHDRLDLLREHGVEPVVALPKSWAYAAEAAQSCRELEAAGIRAQFVNFRAFEEPTLRHQQLGSDEVKSIVEFLQKVRPVLVHSELFAPGVAEACAHLGIAHVAGVYGLDDGWTRPAPHMSFGKHCQVVHADCIHALPRWGDLLQTERFCLHEGIAQCYFDRGRRRLEDMARLASLSLLPPSAPVRILQIGMLHPRTRQLEAIAAVHRLRQQGFNVHLDLVGATHLFPQYRAACRQEIEQGGLSKVVKMHGLVDWKDYLATTDILLRCSTVPRLPVSIPTAFAAGILVVASPSGGIPEVVNDGVSGILCSGFSWSDVALGLSRVLQLQGIQRLELLQRARQFALGKFHRHRAAKDLFTIYTRALQIQRGAAHLAGRPGEEPGTYSMKMYAS